MSLDALGSSLRWLVDVPLSFTPHITLVGAILLGAALSQRLWPAAVPLAFVVLIGAGVLLRSESRLARAEACDAPSLRVTTFNVYAANQDQAALSRLVDARQPAVLVVQELGFNQIPALDALRPTLPHAVGLDPPSLAIFSRLPLETPRSIPVPGATADRGILEVRLQLDGETVTLYSLHAVGYHSPDRTRMQERQFELLRSLVEQTEGPVIVAGDLNATVTSPPLARLLDATGLRTAIAGRREIATWPRWAGPLGVRIDHVLVRGLEVCAVTVGPDAGSDHRAVTADLALAQSTEAP